MLVVAFTVITLRIKTDKSSNSIDPVQTLWTSGGFRGGSVGLGGI